MKNYFYPSILRQITNTQSPDIVEYWKTCLSLHCDARYNKEDIQILRGILIEAFSEIS